MYAMAIAIPAADCNQNLDTPTLESIVGSDASDTVTDRLNTGQIYEGVRVIAAKPLYVTDNNNKRLYTKHAEFRLLSGPLEQLRSRNQGACLFFFVKESPCLGKCLNSEHQNQQYTIIPYLEQFVSWHGKKEQKTAFVFYNIFKEDQGKPGEELRDAFKQIWDHVPLYRCAGQYGCLNCEVSPDVANRNEGCYWSEGNKHDQPSSSQKRPSSEYDQPGFSQKRPNKGH